MLQVAEDCAPAHGYCVRKPAHVKMSVNTSEDARLCTENAAAKILVNTQGSYYGNSVGTGTAAFEPGGGLRYGAGGGFPEIFLVGDRSVATSGGGRRTRMRPGPKTEAKRHDQAQRRRRASGRSSAVRSVEASDMGKGRGVAGVPGASAGAERDLFFFSCAL